jgi:iron-sulfur cluster assembly protein
LLGPPVAEGAFGKFPAEDDGVIEEAGARVFLDPGAASLLDDKVLDAEVAEGQVAFTIADQIE